MKNRKNNIRWISVLLGMVALAFISINIIPASVQSQDIAYHILNDESVYADLYFNSPVNDDQFHECRFWGIIAGDAPGSVIEDHLVNFPNSIKILGAANPNGWSVGYYPDGSLDPVVLRGYQPASTDSAFNAAASEAAAATPRIAVSHVRSTSSGVIPLTGNPHPFERIKNGKHWLMGHNGTIDKNVLLKLIRPGYFAANPPLYGLNQSEWIDSDLYQIFVLQTLEDFNWQVKPALGYVIHRLREKIGPSTSPSTEQLNFFLTDGTNLWGYREGNTLWYLDETSNPTPYSVLASQPPSSSPGSWISMSDGQLITMYQDAAPELENISTYISEVIVDNDGPGTSQEGGYWGYSSGADPYGGSSYTSMTPGASYTFQTDISGLYAVSLWWTYWPSRCTSVPVDIYDGNTLLDTITVNHQENGGKWNFAGLFSFTSGTAKVVVRSESSSCSTCADAVSFFTALNPDLDRIEIEGPESVNENSNADYRCIAYYTDGSSHEVEPDTWGENSAYSTISSTGLLTTTEVSSSEPCRIYATYTENSIARSDDLDITIKDYVAPVELVIDNGESGTSSTGTWLESGGAPPIGDDNLYSKTPGSTYTYQASINGYYEVYLHWTSWPSRCTSVPIRIYNGTQLVWSDTVNQKENGGQWNMIGLSGYNFTGTARVVIEATSTACSTCADAVKFVSAEPPALSFIVITGDSNINENSSVDYTCTAYYTDGSSHEVQPGWNENSDYATISSTGLLTTSEVSSGEPCRISATYTENSITELDNLDITIKDYVPPVEVIIDNDEPGTSYSGGPWGYSSGANPWGPNSRTEMRTGAKYTFETSLDGDYKVYLHWTYWASRCTNSKIEIYNGSTLLDTIPVNQKENASQWNQLGTESYQFSGTARVVVRSDSTSCSTCADAVKFVYTGTVMVAVPNVEGMLQATAATEITNAGLTLGTITQANSDTVPENHIISQSPAGGSLVAAGSSVDIVVSLGPAPVSVPGVVGELSADATSTIITAGFSVGAVTYEYSGSVGVDRVISQDPVGGTLVTPDSSVDLVVSLGPEPTGLVMDPDFGASVDSADLIADGTGRDWYESRNDVPTLLSLNTDVIGSNSTKKAALLNNGTANNAYLTQEFIAPQTGTFAVSFDIYIDSIADLGGTQNRTGFIFLGDDSGGTNGPNSTSNERFAYLTFYDPTPGDTGDDLEIRAREFNTPVQPYAETNTWSSVAGGLSYDTWYTVKVVADVVGGTYDVYVDGVLVKEDIGKYEGFVSNALTHISFAVMSDAQGSVYVDNVTEAALVAVPNCVDMPEAQARDDIAAAGLVAGTTSTDYHAVIAAGNVISTTPAGDSQVPLGATVDLLVSLGPAPVSVPGVVGELSADATSTIITAGFSVGAVTYEYSGSVGVDRVISQDPVGGTLVTPDSSVDLVVSLGPEPTGLVMDPDFGASVDSADLIADGTGRDWYESRNDVPTLLSLNTDVIGSNSTKKAALLNNGTANNAYLTQEFIAPQTGTFAVSFDIYIDSIADLGGTQNRTGFIFLGDDSGGTNGPNSTSNERFAYLTFYDPTPGDTGDDLEIRAREFNTPVQPYAETNTWSSVAGGLSYDTWYTVKVVADVVGGTYDVYVDGVLVKEDIGKYEGFVSNALTHISFAVMSDAQGSVYVDNVTEAALVAVPNCVDMPEAQARDDIAAAGLVAGTTSTDYHAVIAAGNVISTTPAGDSQVPLGATVDLLVSLGPAPVSVPGVVGELSADATSTIITAGFSVGAVTYEYSGSVGVDRVISQDPVGGTLVTPDSSVDLVVSLGPEPTGLVMDPDFGASVDSADLIADGTGRDWYESRNDVPTLLSLNTDVIGSNSTKKAALLNNGTANNAYLTQEFIAPQTGTFAVSFDIYIDSIADLGGTQNRTGFIFLGDDSGGTNGPNSTSNERFAYLTFYDPTPGDTGDDLEIRAREFNTPVQPYAETNTWSSVAGGLSYDTWYTVKVVADVVGGTYDVYVDGVLVKEDIGKYEGFVSSALTHISFAVMSDAQGSVYVDNVVEASSTNTVPTAAGVSITGTPTVGQLLTGNYTYNDADADPEGVSTFRWLRDGTEISGATDQTYTLEGADLGAMIIFEVTPVALTGESPGTAEPSVAVGPVVPFGTDTAPTATGVSITGTPTVGQLLTGNYTYNDAEGDLEGTSTFRWLRDDAVISGATDQTYTLEGADLGAMIIFEVTPVALTGESPGTAEPSVAVGPVVPESEITIDASFDSASIGPAPVIDGNEITFTLNEDNVLDGSCPYRYWFNFKVSNVVDKQINFNLTGIDGSCPVPFFTESSEENQVVYSCDGETWNRFTDHSYSTDGGGTYTFTNTGTFACNEVQVATFLPFSYTKMQNYIDTVRASPWVTVELLGYSQQGRDIELLTITNDASTDPDKEDIFIVGRQHAGETASSHMLKGLIDFLTSEKVDAAALRDHYVWYIVPMVNPDGVYLGRSRETSLGNDPNRDWGNNDSVEINTVRTKINEVDADHEIEFFIDWHSQMNDDSWRSFIYSPSGNTFFNILSNWTDFDVQSASGASGCTSDLCSCRGYIMNQVLFNPTFTFEPTPHLVTWTVDSLKEQGVLVAYAINEYFAASDERVFSDPEFDDSSTSEQLRENSLLQDWYESRGAIPEALLLVTDPVGDNVEGNKAALKTCGMTLGSDDYVYLTQEFSSPQTGQFAVSFDIYIDCIEDDGDRDRTGYIYIGDDSGGSNGPNSGSAERFVFLTFYDPDVSSGTDDLEIRAREYDNPGVNGPDQSWNTTSAWTPVASGLNYQTWYPVRVEVDVPGGTYDVYVNDVLVASDIKKFEKFPSSSLTHLSFSTGYQGKGDFYVDNVRFTEVIDIPDLEVTPGYLGFGTDTETMTFQIKNVGDESFDWTASPDQPWITSIEPDTSPETLNPGESITCSVTIDRDLLGTAFPDNNCRMWGAISNTGLTSDVITHDLITGTTSLQKLTQFENEEGWGMARYTELGGIPIIQRGPIQAYYDPNFDNAVSAMAGATPKVAIAHVRNCTSGCCNPSEQIIDDPHPFYRQKNGKTWLFMHNGAISKTLLTNLIGEEYLAANPPNGSDIPDCDPNIPDKVVDSELYFLLVLKNIEERGWDVEKGIVETVFQMIGVSTTNFILTDGTTIWAYRNGHDLAFFYDAGTGISSVASQPPEDTGWTIMKDKELVILKPGEAPKLFNVNDYPEGFVGWVTVETNHGEIAYVEAEADYAQEEIIVDNGEVPGTSYTGSWSPSSGASPYGTTSGSLTTMTPGSTYTFEAPVDGFYNVSLWWTYWSSRCTNVPVDIYDGPTLLDTVEVNQQENGGRWNQVGTYAFSSGTARIVVRAESSSCSTCADAVRFVSTLPPEFDRITVDGPNVVDENTSEQYVCIAHYVNGATRVVDPESCEVDCDNVSITPDGLLTASEVDSPEECQVTMTYMDGGTTYSGNMDISIRDSLSLDDGRPGTEYTGDWSPSSGPNYFGVGSLYSMDPGATYSFEAPLTGSYDVQVWWTQTSGRCTGVPIRIYNGDTLLDTVEVNQKVDGGKFNSIGVYEFTGIARVTIVSESSGCSTNADAVRFVSAEPPEDIFACLTYGPGGAYDRSRFIDIIEGFGAEQVGDIWVYRNETLGKTFRFHIVEDIDGMRQALYTKGATVLVRGHANYGSGPIFATQAEQLSQVIDDFYYIDDDRIFNISSEWVSLDIHGMRASQAYPFYWPQYKDKTSGIMPFDFGDPLNPPPYNYYLTYQVPGDPTGTHYKVESAHNSAIERFPDSYSPAWYSAEGLSPNFDNPLHKQYFITNSTPWSPSFLTTGDWTETYSGTGYFKENYTYALPGTGESQAQWLFDIPEAGNYTVSAWWSASSSNSTGAPFTIHHGLGSNTVTRNQTLNGAQWVELGDFYFAPSLGWYESRGTIPDALSLVSYDVGGNSGNKAFLQTSGMSLGTDDYVYLSQAFTDAQAGTFSTSCDIYVDAIDDDADRDRTAYIYIGNDAEGSNGPNSTSSERFVFLTFYDPDLSNDISVNDLQLKARELDAPAQSWNTTSDWTMIKDGLSYHNWYNIEIEVNVAAGTYDVYVDGVLEGDDISKWEGYSSPTVTQISFSTGAAGQGNFYVDNVEAPPGLSSLIVDSAFDDNADSEVLREKNAPDYSVVLTNAVASGRVVADAIRISHADNPPEVIEADFYAALPRSGEAPLQVNFENQSTGDISARHWDFGDGTTNDTRDSVEHSYTAPGTYTVSLTVSGPAGGDTETKVNYITIGGATPLQAEFSSPSNRESTAPFEISFEDRSSGNIVSWLWDFGDGQTSISRNPAHTYSSPGLYSVSLTVTDASHIVTETKQSFIRAKAKFDTTIDNVDYPITHFRNKVIINRGPLEIDKAQLQYSRLFYLACNTGNYFIDTFNRGVMFYDLNTTWVGVENGFSAYLNAYVQGKSDEEIWEQLQALDPVFDYYDFNKYPDEQGGG